MSVIKLDKEQLQSVVTELKSDIKTLKTSKNSLKTAIGNAKNYDGLNISGAGNKLKKNLDAVLEELETVQSNMDRYVGQVLDFDVDDFNGSSKYIEMKNAQILPPVEESGGVSTNEFVYYASPTYTPKKITYSTGTRSANTTLSYSSTGTQAPGVVKALGDSKVINLPAGIGSVHTYMGWQCITSRSSTQYKLIEAAGMNFDEEGFGKIGDRYVIACTTTYGNVGDYVDIVQEDGTILKCIIGDIKNQNDAGCNEWGHNNGQCVVEFVVDKNTWYSGGKGSHANPGTASCHPEWNQNIVQVINRGSYFDSPEGPKEITIAEPGKSVAYTVGGNTNIDLSKYHNNPSAGFEVTTGNQTYNLSAEDYDLICSIVAAESDQGYDDALAVASTILNRCETPNWINAHGTNPVAQATAPNQFVVYQHGSYKKYTNGNAPDTVKVAVMDALNGVRNHDYLSFRSNGSTGYSSNMISSTGNRYK
jgi:hypothetical protein